MAFKIVRNEISKMNVETVAAEFGFDPAGNGDAEEKLRSYYTENLKSASERGVRSIAFPLIADDSFGYAKEEGIRIAADEIRAFLEDNEMEVFLVVSDDVSNALSRKINPALKAYIDRHYVEEQWDREYDDAPRAPRPPQMNMQGLMSGSMREGMFGAAMMPAAMGDAPAKPAKRGLFKRAKKDAERKAGTAVFKDEVYAEEACEKATYAEAGFLDFESEHESKLEERMSHLQDTFSQYLLYLIKDKQMENAEVYKRAIVDKKIFSKIKNNVDYHPQKLTALCLCVGAKLNLDESKDLLARAGYALSPCDKTDIIFSYFIENEIYDMIELDIQLEEHGLPCIIT